MSDQFHDTRTYSKRTTNANPQAKQQYNRFMSIYGAYAKLVNVAKVDDAFKNKVDEFRRFFEVPSFQRPTGLVRSQWIDYYNK